MPSHQWDRFIDTRKAEPVYFFFLRSVTDFAGADNIIDWCHEQYGPPDMRAMTSTPYYNDDVMDDIYEIDAKPVKYWESRWTYLIEYRPDLSFPTYAVAFADSGDAAMFKLRNL